MNMLNSRQPSILIMDDDASLLKLLRRDLQLEGFQVMTATDGEEGLDLLKEEGADLILLDVMMPGPDGFEVCSRVRESSDVPIVMLTAKCKVEDVTKALDLGADDYVTKPFSTNEFVARIRAVLRRSNFTFDDRSAVLVAGDLVIDPSNAQVTKKGEDIVLTLTDFRILHILASNAGRVFTHDDLIRAVWGDKYAGRWHILRVAVNRLRRKLGDDPSDPTYITTRPGIGYVFKATLGHVG